MLKDTAPKPQSGTVNKARRLRKEMSLPEVLLWRELRQRSDGVKFRRQHPSGPYILDFYCSDARLAIEVDSEAHALEGCAARDNRRDAWFHENGIETLRIAAADILCDPTKAADALYRYALARIPEAPPRACLGEGDHPQDGGGVARERLTPVAESPSAPVGAAPPSCADAQSTSPRQARGGSKEG